MGAHPINSLIYATCFLLLFNFIVVWHLLRTTITGAQALLFGSLMALTISSRFLFGEDPQLVTLAMNYNRYCTAFICSLVSFFIPSRLTTKYALLVDSFLVSSITILLFYSKIIFGLCALALVVLLPMVSRQNKLLAFLSLGYFIVVVAVLEATLGFHVSLVRDILMAIRSSGATRTTIFMRLSSTSPRFSSARSCRPLLCSSVAL